MHYEEILQNINCEMDASSTDLYRYNSLLEAIRYFANPLTLEQITDMAFDFVNEILTVDKSVLYILESGKYKAIKRRGVHVLLEDIKSNARLSGFALYVGNVISGPLALEPYFGTALVEALDATVMIPLILDKKLYGFFLLSRRITGQFNDSDIVVCETLMNLFNNAIESCRRLDDLQRINRDLDEKVFNLFAINQSAKAMLTEHRLSELYRLAVDVFSELTQSRNTGFVLYDDASEKYALKAYRDVFSTVHQNLGYLTKNPDMPCSVNHQILDMSKEFDRNYLESIFPGGTEFMTELKTHYVVFICDYKQELLGFVTLGETITGAPYKKSSFELVDSLASYTYIALSNALLIKKVNNQKTLLQEKVDRLVKLNLLSKNITSALDSKSLMALTIETLSISFGAEISFIALYNEDEEKLEVSHSSDFSLSGTIIPMSPSLQALKMGRTVFESNSDNIHTVIGQEIAGFIRNNSGVLAVPLTLDRYELKLVGALFIFKLHEGQLSDEENVLTFETIANQVAPLLEGFFSLERQKKLYKPDMAATFMMELEKQISECLIYDFDMEIIRVKDNSASPFKGNTTAQRIPQSITGAYPISYDLTDIIVTQDFSYNFGIIQGVLSGNDISLSRFKFKTDFNSLEDYLKL